MNMMMMMIMMMMTVSFKRALSLICFSEGTTAWSRILLETLTVFHLIKRLAVLHKKTTVHYRVQNSPPLSLS
jgi:hypothetical protein